MKTQKVLLTGCAGYIGSVMTRFLLQEGYEVWGLDSLVFGDSGLTEIYDHPQFHFFLGDVVTGDHLEEILPEVSGVIHLAGISGMPSCDKFPESAQRVNFQATKDLFDKVQTHSNVERFVMASTTSIFGATETGEIVDEDTTPNPLSLYAETKLQCEEYLQRPEKRDDLTVVIFRFPTAFGLSPRMRFDLTVNEFARDLTLGNDLEIYGAGFWRPYCHVNDLSRACIFGLEVPKDQVDQEVICVGGQQQNFTKMMIFESLKEIIPNAKVSMVERVVDARDYKVRFEKMERLGFEITRTMSDGIREVHEAVRTGHFDNPMDPALTSVLTKEI